MTEKQLLKPKLKSVQGYSLEHTITGSSAGEGYMIGIYRESAEVEQTPPDQMLHAVQLATPDQNRVVVGLFDRETAQTMAIELALSILRGDLDLDYEEEETQTS